MTRPRISLDRISGHAAFRGTLIVCVLLQVGWFALLMLTGLSSMACERPDRCGIGWAFPLVYAGMFLLPVTLCGIVLLAGHTSKTDSGPD